MRVCTLVCLVLVFAGQAYGSATDEEKCTAGRADAAGKYLRCTQKYLAGCYRGSVYVDSCNDIVQPALSKCRYKYAKEWSKLEKLKGTLCAVSRFVDNGDGTVTDNLTGLVWEKKTTDATVHAIYNSYSWSTGPPYAENGTVFTGFLATLNSGGGFAGSNGWRLPTVAELLSITDPSPNCDHESCIDPVFGPSDG